MAPRLLPLFLKLDGRAVLVVGAGNVAERKIEDLVEAGARVHVVAKAASARVRELAAQGKLALDERIFEPRDMDGAWLCFAATSDPAAQAQVAATAEQRQVFCVAIDDIPNTSAYSASVIRRDPFTVAISSSGEAPALARLLREVLEQALPDEGWLEAARAMRERWRREGTPMSSRFGELVRAFKEKT